MTKKLLLSAGLALILAACDSGTKIDVPDITLPAGVKLVDSVSKKGNDVVIPFKKYTLDNGLTVVLHEDKSDPLVHVDITYHVGSGREEAGRSGFAHFFEHMMFQGSENVADEQHFGLITESGGTLNGSTNTDRTNYYETVPANQLEKMLWLEADRMGYFLNAVTQKKFEIQRETVKNERGQRVDNAPYGLLGERVGEALYPEGHPYSWSVIGYLEDLDRADLNDLKNFFLRWYGPNNATLTIGGDIDEAQTLEWVEKYFGSIPTGPEVKAPVYEPVVLDADRYISLEDNVSLPLIRMVWPTVHRNHPDEAPLDVLMYILGQGKTSLLYKNLVKDGLAVQAGTNHGCSELSCNFTVTALPNPASGSSLADLEKVARESFVEFESRGVEDDDLVRVKADIVSGLIYSLESVSSKVTQLASFETFGNDPNGIGNEISRYENVTKADVMRTYETYIKGKPAVIMSIVPKGQKDAIAHADTWQRYERTLPENMPTSDVSWTLPADDFDRSVVPPTGAALTIKAPSVYKAELSNGIKVLGAMNDEVPTTTISVRVRASQAIEPLDKLGLASLTAAMLDEATTESSAEDLSNRLDKLGSSVSFGSGDTYTSMRIRTLSKNLDETAAIAMEKMFKPKFDEADFARLKAQTIEGIKQSKKRPTSVASELFNRKMYGDDNAFAWNGSGTIDTVSNITLDDVKAFYADNYSASVAAVVAVSDLPKAKIVGALDGLSGWEAKPVATVTAAAFPDIGKPTIYFVDKPNAAQSEIRIGKRALPYDATGEYYRSTLMNYPLGGAFNSRINLNLREDKGYTYGARSFFNGEQTRGYYVASSGVKADTTAASITEFLNEIRNFHENGITEEELAFTKSAIGQSDARAYETPGQKLGFLGRMMTYDLDAGFVDEQSKVLQSMTKAEIDALAKKHINPNEMIILVVGDKELNMESLKELGLPIVEIDADGNPL